MPRTAIVFTTTTGNTQYVAEMLHKLLGAEKAALIDIAKADMSQLSGYRDLVCCVSTWGLGDMQDDWERLAPDFGKLDLTGKQVAILGLGDQKNYPSAFADGVRKLADLLRGMGADLVGKTPTEGYEFTVSRAVENKSFLGLIIDEDNQHDLTEVRLRDWAAQLKKEFRY